MAVFPAYCGMTTALIARPSTKKPIETPAPRATGLKRWRSTPCGQCYLGDDAMRTAWLHCVEQRPATAAARCFGGAIVMLRLRNGRSLEAARGAGSHCSRPAPRRDGRLAAKADATLASISRCGPAN
jgi:hypothetical protein